VDLSEGSRALKEKGSYWKGSVGGRTGLFPRTCVREPILKEEPALPQKVEVSSRVDVDASALQHSQALLRASEEENARLRGVAEQKELELQQQRQLHERHQQERAAAAEAESRAAGRMHGAPQAVTEPPDDGLLHMVGEGDCLWNWCHAVERRLFALDAQLRSRDAVQALESRMAVQETHTKDRLLILEERGDQCDLSIRNLDKRVGQVQQQGTEEIIRNQRQLERRLDGIEVRLCQHEQSLEEKWRMLERHEKRLTRLENTDNDDLAQLCQRLQQENSEYESRCADIKRKQTQLEKANERMNTMLVRLEETCESQVKPVLQLSKEFKDLTENVQLLECGVGHHDESIRQHQGVLAEYSAVIEKLTQRILN